MCCWRTTDTSSSWVSLCQSQTRLCFWSKRSSSGM
ncbi:unnamed protein product [Gulo gulo]|uniref:Uncharacterized protein n=1 Tax=Gulo gulo TaxID=48420 RepID=A0A9X9Q0A2_GULGU|nr:unnamed protein product [Gulo gulo]